MITELENKELYTTEHRGNLVVRPKDYSDMYDVELTGIPAKILTLMMMNPNRLIKMSDIIDEVWAGTKEMDPRAVRLVDVYIVRIRGFLRDCHIKAEVIKAFHYLYFRTEETKNLQSSEKCRVL